VRKRRRPKVRLRWDYFHRGIEVLGYGFAAEATCDRANGCTDNGAHRTGGDRADRRTSSDTACDTACRCSKPDSNRMRTWRASDWIGISRSFFCLVMVHTVLQCGALRRHYPACRTANVNSDG
jgi:hypothetical protein